MAATRELLGMLPQRFGDGTGPLAPAAPASGAAPDANVPAEARKVYDVRDTARAIVDGGRILELSGRWATNMITALARIEGRPVGILANQPRRLGGVIDTVAAEKAALFVDACDRFGLPIAVLVDTPGFMPGTRQESGGVIRHGASLLRAFAAARVPKVTVILRKAYGGAVITMNSRDLGADLVFAWPQAEIGIMAARQAVGIVHRRDLAAAAERRDAALADLAAGYADEHLGAERAAASGFVDEVIEPTQTRERLAWAFASLERR
jgi:acetyl-CoA carboxylase carboxyltransferase component